MRGKTIHQIAPRPETIAPRHAVFGHARHRPLETVAVQVRQCGQQCINADVTRLHDLIGFNRGDRLIHHCQANVACPARAQLCMFGENHLTAFRVFMYRHIGYISALEK